MDFTKSKHFVANCDLFDIVLGLNKRCRDAVEVSRLSSRCHDTDMENNGTRQKNASESPVSESPAATNFPSGGQWYTCTAAPRSDRNVDNEEDKCLTNITFKVFLCCPFFPFSQNFSYLSV